MTHMPLISVCIPAYDMAGKGADFLRVAFDSLAEQSFQDFEVVVSDQSETEAVADLCRAFSGQLDITRLDFRDGPRQASANVNHAIAQAQGWIVKILFQDDYLLDPNALRSVFSAFECGSCKWLVTGSVNVQDGRRMGRAKVPRWHSQIRFGRNTISNPSVLAFLAHQDTWFDEALIWLMDVDLYHCLYRAFGAPVILPDPLVATRLHSDQVSAKVTRKLRRKELLYMLRKSGLRGGPKDISSFLYQYLKALG